MGEISNNKSENLSEALIVKIQKVIENTSLNNKFPNIINKEKINVFIRKCAHIFEFLILAIIVYFLMVSLKLNHREVIIYTLFIILLYAVIDEFRQLYIQGRHSQVRDIIIDFIGGVIGVILCEITFKIIRFRVKFRIK